MDTFLSPLFPLNHAYHQNRIVNRKTEKVIDQRRTVSEKVEQVQRSPLSLLFFPFCFCLLLSFSLFSSPLPSLLPILSLRTLHCSFFCISDIYCNTTDSIFFAFFITETTTQAVMFRWMSSSKSTLRLLALQQT